MSWDADLTCVCCGSSRDWNYTHNTNGMIAAALEAAGDPEVEQCRGSLGAVIGPAWWDRLNGLNGAEGAGLLHRIITELERDPPTYQAMNPPNGWGNYTSLLEVLSRMRDAVGEWPSTWEVHG